MDNRVPRRMEIQCLNHRTSFTDKYLPSMNSLLQGTSECCLLPIHAFPELQLL